MQPYIFVSYPFSDEQLFDRVAQIVRQTVKLKCENGKVGANRELRSHILELIGHSELLIADLSSLNVNVIYEIGYAAGINKPTLLLSRAGNKVPSDLQGHKWIQYEDLNEDFDTALAQHLKWQFDVSRIALLRQMLEAPDPQPAYILASPRYPGYGAQSHVQYVDTKTFGDNLGILGLISSFASMWGPGEGVQLISAQYSPDDIFESDLNLFLIGSPKANPHTEKALSILQGGNPIWSFKTPISHQSSPDYAIRLERKVFDTQVPYLGESKPNEAVAGTRTHSGYGLLMRGPGKSPDRTITIMAGERSVGTGAACLAATDPELIKSVFQKLPRDVDSADKRRTIWALVYGEYSDPKRLLEPTMVTVVEAGSFPAPRQYNR